MCMCVTGIQIDDVDDEESEFPCFYVCTTLPFQVQKERASDEHTTERSKEFNSFNKQK